MIRATKYLLMSALVGATLLMGASESQARWWWGASYGYWDSCCDGYYGVSWGGWGWSRPWGRLAAWRHGGWGCGWRAGCWDACCYSSCCYDPCYTSYATVSSCCAPVQYGVVSYGGVAVCDPVMSGTVIAPAAPVQVQQAPTPAPMPQGERSIDQDLDGGLDTPAGSGLPPATPPRPTDAEGAPTTDLLPGLRIEPTAEDSGKITIWVPADAKVLVNGLETKSVGSRRSYVSHGLVPGYRYKYTVVARIERGGRELEETETVILTAGEATMVAFGFQPERAEGLASIAP